MFFGEGSQRAPVIPHFAPNGEPFNLQVPPAGAASIAMIAAPVPKGGVSFHDGGAAPVRPNDSQRWRRACALHYVRNDNAFVYARAALRRNDV